MDQQQILNKMLQGKFLLLRQEHDLSDSTTGFDELLKALVTPPLYTIVRVNTLKTTINDAQQELQKILKKVCESKVYLGS